MKLPTMLLGKVLHNNKVETELIKVLRINSDESWLGDIYVTDDAGFARKTFVYRERDCEYWVRRDVFGLS